jgi:hypothetical protein
MPKHEDGDDEDLERLAEGLKVREASCPCPGILECQCYPDYPVKSLHTTICCRYWGPLLTQHAVWLPLRKQPILHPVHPCMAVILDPDVVLQGKKEKKKREKKSGKELLQIGEPEEQLSFFEELEQEVSNKDPSVLTLCGMLRLRCQCVNSAALTAPQHGDLLRLLYCCNCALLCSWVMARVLPACSRHALALHRRARLQIWTPPASQGCLRLLASLIWGRARVLCGT